MTFHHQIPKHFQIKGSIIFLLRHLLKNNQFLKEAQLDNARNIEDVLKDANAGQVIMVERVENLDELSFLKNYLNKGLPVIFSGEAATWKSTRKWSFDYFSSRFGEQEYPVINIEGLTDVSDQKKNRKISLKDYSRSLRRQETEDYLRFCSLIEANPSLEDDLDQKWLTKMRKCFLGISYQSFLGPKGRRTPLHSDTTAFFYIMTEGSKKWTMFSPTALSVLNPQAAGKGYNFTHLDIRESSSNEFPGSEVISRYQCVLEKGDILFVPAWMWHEVENLTDSIGISYRFTSLRGFFQFPFYALLRTFFTKPSFLQVIYYSFFKNDLYQRNEFLLTPKIKLKK